MEWKKAHWLRAERLPVWAALCAGRADGSNPQYPAGQKHAILAMVRAHESEAENAISSLLHSNGWVDLELRNLKLLNEPFHSDDPTMVACYENATKKQAGIVVYLDAIREG